MQGSTHALNGSGKTRPQDVASIIVTARDPRALKKLKCQCRACGIITHDLSLIGGFAATVKARQASSLLKSSSETKGITVTVDPQIIPYPHRARPSRPAPPPSIWLSTENNRPDPSRATLKLDKVHELGITGKGVTVAVIDSGIFAHPDFKERVVAWKDMQNRSDKPYDTHGHGTHVAGVIAGNGKSSEGRFAGVAPEAQIVAVRVPPDHTLSTVIAALQWVIENKENYNIKVVNLSLGIDPDEPQYNPSLKKYPSYRDDPMDQMVRKAVEAGLVVVTVAGNEFPRKGEKSITVPGDSPDAITVGSMDDRRTPDPSDDTMDPESSHGPTLRDNLPKPDVVAPGINVISTLSPSSLLHKQEAPYAKDYMPISGTSQAAPFVSGTAALLFQANPDLTPQQVKQIIMETAKPLNGASENIQGKGRIDPLAAVQKALAMKKDHAAV